MHHSDLGGTDGAAEDGDLSNVSVEVLAWRRVAADVDNASVRARPAVRAARAYERAVDIGRIAVRRAIISDDDVVPAIELNIRDDWVDALGLTPLIEKKLW